MGGSVPQQVDPRTQPGEPVVVVPDDREVYDESEELEGLDRLPSLLDDGGLVGRSDAMRELGELLTKAADSEATVLVTGETGTGKELVARVLHQRSRRSAGPFVAVNCAAVPETLLESELFGHLRGAFTNATHDKVGLFEHAHGGTLFLDELAETSPDVQAKLLRALQERKIRPVGATDERDVDVRLVAATNKCLQSVVEEGKFREDLYFRINVIEVDVPPLRERGDDVLLLAHYLLMRMARETGKDVRGFDEEVLGALVAYRWPGNVRELENCVARAVTLTDGELIQLKDLPVAVRAACDDRPPPAEVMGRDAAGDERLLPLSVIEARYVRHVLAKMNGNKTQAAKVLGIDRRTLHRKLRAMSPKGLDS